MVGGVRRYEYDSEVGEQREEREREREREALEVQKIWEFWKEGFFFGIAWMLFTYLFGFFGAEGDVCWWLGWGKEGLPFIDA